MSFTPVHIIAEAGTTHEGQVETALKLVDAAHGAGADSVKFQFIDPEHLYLPLLRENGALVPNPAIVARQAQVLTDEAWTKVANHARTIGIPFSSSVFDTGRLAFLLGLDAPYVKIASTDLNNDGLIEAVIDTGKPLLLSTGMSSLGEIDHAVELLTRKAARHVVLFHCVSAYPCPTALSNVGFVATLKRCFDFPIGFSDHTENSVAGVAAVALGATWLEKHMTLDRGAKGFDHAYAMEPASLAAYIADIRAAEAALAPRVPKVGVEEATVRLRARRSLWAARDLPAGHSLEAGDILVVRPSGPLAPSDLPRVLNRTLARPISASSPIRLQDIQE